MEHKIGFTCGAFDLCHPGHTQMFEWCKQHCSYLIVGIQVDPSIDRPEKAKPIEPLHIRSLRLYQNKDIDFVIPYHTEQDLESLLRLLNISVRFLDISYAEKEFTGKALSTSLMLHELMYNPRSHDLSSTSLRQKIESVS